MKVFVCDERVPGGFRDAVEPSVLFHVRSIACAVEFH